jgi:CBS domain-containing protein
MPIGEICVRDTVVCGRNTTILEAAQLMRQHHVGDLVVIEESEGKRIPVGILTDRDIVLSVVSLKIDSSVFSVGDVVSNEMITIREDQGVFETMRQMRTHGIRRIPVVNERGGLVGIVSIDDLIQLLAEEMGEMAKLISREQAREVQVRC